MKLEDDDVLDDLYLFSNGTDITIEINNKEMPVSKIKLSHRDGKGTKVRK